MSESTKRYTLKPAPKTPYGALEPTLSPYHGTVEVEAGLAVITQETDKLLKELGVTETVEVEAKDPRKLYNEEQAALSTISPPRIKDLTWEMWQRAVSNAALLGRAGKKIDADTLKVMMPDVPISLLIELLSNEKFARILEERGVIDDESPVGMTERQMQTLALLTNFTDKRAIQTKLRSIGVPDWEFQQWLGGNSRFKRLYRKFSEQLFDEAQPAVNVALSTLAVEGDLRAIKYFNEISGRWDPNSKQVMDVQALLRGIMEILTSTITDPDLLRLIGGKLAVLVGSLNSGTGSAAAVPQQSIAEPTSTKASYELEAGGLNAILGI